MKKQLQFVELLFEDLRKNVRTYIEFSANNADWWEKNFMNADHGKTALKRKITYLRRELLNLERMLK